MASSFALSDEQPESKKVPPNPAAATFHSLFGPARCPILFVLIIFLVMSPCCSPEMSRGERARRLAAAPSQFSLPPSRKPLPGPYRRLL